MGRGRLSFLNRGGSVKLSEAQQGERAAGAVMLKPVLANGVGHSVVKNDDASVHSRGSATRERSKENNRRSFFGGSAANQRSENGDGGDGDWVTDSGIGQDGHGAAGIPARMSSIGKSDSGSTVGSRVGSVRKRLSMLKLGKKSSKASVLVDSVAEE